MLRLQMRLSSNHGTSHKQRQVVAGRPAAVTMQWSCTDKPAQEPQGPETHLGECMRFK